MNSDYQLERELQICSCFQIQVDVFDDEEAAEYHSTVLISPRRIGQTEIVEFEKIFFLKR